MTSLKLSIEINKHVKECTGVINLTKILTLKLILFK